MGPYTFKELKQFIKADLKYTGGKDIRCFFDRYLFEAGFKYIVWLRTTRYFYLKGKKAFLFYAFARMILKHYGYKYHFDVSYRAEIGKGFTIPHYGYLVVTSNTVMGEDCTVRPGVIIGKNLASDQGGAVIGNNVDFGVGCKIVGEKHIGNNVIIGANAVVTKDIPDNVIVGGIPARIIREREI